MATIKPTAFDELRFGYFDTAFGSIFKCMRGGATPIATTTLAMCSVSAWSEIQWAIEDQDSFEISGELKSSCNKPGDRKLFTQWLNRWVQQTSLNSSCDAVRAYGLRCALVHSGASSDALGRSGVAAWLITMEKPASHYTLEDVASARRFSIYLPYFLAEIILAADHMLNDQKEILLKASPQLRARIGFIGIPLSYDLSSRLINNNGSLAWFDERLADSPLKISRDDLAERIRAEHQQAKEAGLITQ